MPIKPPRAPENRAGTALTSYLSIKSSTNTLLSSQTAAPQPSETTRNKTRQKSEKTQTETVSNLEAQHRRAAKENSTPKQKQTQTATPQPLKNKHSTACREMCYNVQK